MNKDNNNSPLKFNPSESKKVHVERTKAKVVKAKPVITANSRIHTTTQNMIMRHWKMYSILIVVLLVIAGTTMFLYERSVRNSAIEAQEIVTASTQQELEQVIKKYPSAKEVNYSRLNLASMLVKDKKYDEALNVLKDEVANGNEVYPKELAQLNIAYISEIKGDVNDAISQLQKLAESSTTNSIKAEAYYSAGRMLMASGKKDEAIKSLKLCIDTKDNQGWKEFSESIINDSK